MNNFYKVNHNIKLSKPRSVFLDVKPTIEKNSYQNNRYPFHKEAFVVEREFVLEDVAYQNLKPVLMVLRAMGAFPFSRKAPGQFQFQPMSWPFLYAVTIFICLLSYVGYVAKHRIDIVTSLEGRFEESVIAYLFLVNILPTLIIPLVWLETPKVAALLNDWAEFEILYFKISGMPLPLDIKKNALIVAIVLPILSTMSVVVIHVTMVEFKLTQIIPYCFVDNLTYMMGAYWYLTCESLSNAASILADDFQKAHFRHTLAQLILIYNVFQALRHIGPAAMVADYRSLWLRLSKLTRDTGTATCFTFTFINLYLFFLITLSIYGLMSQLSEGFGVKDIGLAVAASCSICLLFFICDEAHYASNRVRTDFQKKLLMVELSWMNTDAQTEINMFLRATEMNPSNINCGGFFDINRNLFKSLLTTMVTYLVVLLQFQISLPEENGLGISNSTKIDKNITEQSASST